MDIGPDLDLALPPNAKHGGHHNKPVSVETLCGMWTEGKLSDLWHLAEVCTSLSKQSSLPHGNTVIKRVGSAVSIAQNGLFCKACQVLVSPDCYETWRLLVAKHPECACPSVPTVSPVNTAIPPDLNMMAVLRSLLMLTASGLGKPMHQPSRHPFSSLRAVINCLAVGRVPNGGVKIALQ